MDGLRAHKLCRGDDDTLLCPSALPELIEESMELDWPAENVEPLLFAMKTTLDRLCARLSGRKKAAVKLGVTLRLDPSGSESLTLCLARPSAAARLLLDLAKHRISDLTLRNPVAGLRVRIEESCEDPGQQLVLGDAPGGDAALEVVLSRLQSTLGEETLFAAELSASHQPEAAYASKPFRPPPGGGQGPWQGAALGRPLAEVPPAASDEVFSYRPSRFFNRPASLEAELGSVGELLAARLLGRKRKVTAVAGPERLCGAWWDSSAYARDYYRVHFEGLGPVWIFRDGRDDRYYLHGMFD